MPLSWLALDSEGRKWKVTLEAGSMTAERIEPQLAPAPLVADQVSHEVKVEDAGA